MGQPPAVVIIARHGARLDAADRQWHLTSPTPYDPPLTYGGWTQARALGARIASILRARESLSPSVSTTPDGDTTAGSSLPEHVAHPGSKTDSARVQKRKHRVIIHTSPYLRCLQTSIAIAAGMAQYHSTGLSNATLTRPLEKSRLRSSSCSLTAIPEPGGESPSNPADTGRPESQFTKPLLRVDASLGEWLNPEYYEQITAPPSSVMMVASAKAELLRPGDYSPSEFDQYTKPSLGFPGGWGSKSDPEPVSKDEAIFKLKDLQEALPPRSSSTHNGVNGPRSRPNLGTGALSRTLSENRAGYVAPTPRYAVSPSGPIPPGYVAHARDACIEVDYQWDSMRESQEWGDGGEYGEEWSTMHARCRRALQKMLTWYRDMDDSETRLAKPREAHHNGSKSPAEDDALTETVVILVSHGAACNAFIGALTDSPVLMDVGMASLTLAERKDSLHVPSPTTTTRIQGRPVSGRRRASESMLISDAYQVTAMASIEHLRPGSTHLLIPRLQTSNFSRSHSPHRRRYASGSSSVDENSLTRGRSTRSAGIGSGLFGGATSPGPPSASPPTWSPATAPAARRPSTGLWSRPLLTDVAVADDDESSPGENMVLNFKASGDSSPELAKEVAKSPENGSAGAGHNQPGLWGTSSDTLAALDRDKGTKRRWSVDDPGA